MKIRAVADELFHADRRTEGRTNMTHLNLFSKFRERAK